MKKFEAFLIFINNLSYIYIFTTIAMFLSIFLTCFAKFMNNGREEKYDKKFQNLDVESDDDEIIQENVTNGLLSKIKLAKYKEIEENLSEDQIQEEKSVEREQLAAILKLLKAQEVELNTTEIDENQLKKQLKLYR